MRLLLALFLVVPGFAQEAPAAQSPAQPAAAAQSPAQPAAAAQTPAQLAAAALSPAQPAAAALSPAQPAAAAQTPAQPAAAAQTPAQPAAAAQSPAQPAAAAQSPAQPAAAAQSPAQPAAATQTPAQPAAAAQSPAQPAAAAQSPAQPAAAAQSPAQPAAKADEPAPRAKADEAAAPSPKPSTEEWFTGSVDFGYRWQANLSGDAGMYRSVVNLGQGPKLTGLDFSIVDPQKRLFDELDARGYGWGGDPYSTAHVDARKAGVYDLTFDYRNMAYFNATPSFANPTAPAGFDEQSFDIHRRNLSADLELRPGKRVIPYLAFDRNSGYGHGITDWVPDQNDKFAVPTLLRDSTNNYRGGLRFEYNRFHATLEQGGTTFKDDDLASESGVTPGDRSGTLLGQTIALSSLQEAYGIRGDSVYSKAVATASPFPWLDLYGQFVFSEPRTTVNYSDAATGNFALLSSLLFYSGQQNLGTGLRQPAAHHRERRVRSAAAGARAHNRIVDDGPVSRRGLAVRHPELYTLRRHRRAADPATGHGPELRPGGELQPGADRGDLHGHLEAHAARRVPGGVGRFHRAGGAVEPDRQPGERPTAPQRGAGGAGVPRQPEAVAEPGLRRRIERPHLLPHQPERLPSRAGAGAIQVDRHAVAGRRASRC